MEMLRLPESEKNLKMCLFRIDEHDRRTPRNGTSHAYAQHRAAIKMHVHVHVHVRNHLVKNFK